MKGALLIITAFTLGLPGCKQDELSCSSLDTQYSLKSLISTPRHSQELEDYTAEIDIGFSDLRRADLPSVQGGLLCLGQVALAENVSRGLPRREFGIGYEIWGKPNSLSVRILTPDGY